MEPTNSRTRKAIIKNETKHHRRPSFQDGGVVMNNYGTSPIKVETNDDDTKYFNNNNIFFNYIIILLYTFSSDDDDVMMI